MQNEEPLLLPKIKTGGSSVSNQSVGSQIKKLDRSGRRQSSYSSRKSKVIEGEVDDEEPELVPYCFRPGVRISTACALEPCMYTLGFMANIEHWYGVPFEHSDTDVDNLFM